MNKNFELTGKSALITGAAGLLGVEHALSLAEAGAYVLMTDVNVKALHVAKNRVLDEYRSAHVEACEMNVTNSNSVETVAGELAQSGRRIDILVNNAAIDPKVRDDGGLTESSRLENFDLAQWNLQLEVGLTGAFLCSQRFGSAMARDGRGGVIVNIASDLSIFAPDQRIYRKKDLSEDRQPVKPVTYSVIKAGLVGLTRYLATYWAEQGVRCNALSPGGVYNGQDEEFVQRLTSLIPLGRMARPDEYRSALRFLCSDASSYMNGQNLVLDGGRSAW